jgi:HSP20 family protein
MPEKALATQPARGLTILKFKEIDKVFDHVKEITDSIARRAFELFESKGREFGRDLENWFKAETELLHPVHVKVSESDEALQVQAEVPGFSAKELEVSVEPRRLTITGKRETKEEHKTKKTICSERCADQILRVIELPAEVETLKVKAILKDGLLELAMPKAASAKKVPIEPKVA